MAIAKTEGFRVLPSYYEAIRDIPDEERLKLYDALFDFGFGNEISELPPILNSLFRLIEPTLTKSIKFEAKQKANGQQGGRPPKPKHNTEETQLKPKETQTDSGENLAVAVAFAVANDIAIEKEAAQPPRATHFTPPSLEEVTAYVKERGSKVDPQCFIDFYTAKGWKIGRNPMRDWKAACRNAEKWERWESGKKPDIRRPNDYYQETEGSL